MTILTAAATAQTRHPANYLEITRVQEVLYESGFEIEKVDGVMGQNTARAIADWQRSRGLPRTGYLTTAQMNEIELSGEKIFPKGRRWASLSVSSDGKFAYDWQRYTRSGAVLTTKRRCQRQSRKPKDCITYAVFGSAGIAAIYCGNRGAFIFRASSKEAAEQGAFVAAVRRGYQRGQCRLLARVSSNDGPDDWSVPTEKFEEWWKE